jgi:hypothetical protein
MDLLPKGKPNQPQDNKKPSGSSSDRKGNSVISVNINIDEEINKIFIQAQNHLTRNHPNSIYWFKLQYLNLFNLYKMNRQPDCLQIIRQLVQYSGELNDTFYFIRLKEIEIMIHLLNYNLKDAEITYQEIITRSKTNYIVIF